MKKEKWYLPYPMDEKFVEIKKRILNATEDDIDEILKTLEKNYPSQWENWKYDPKLDTEEQSDFHKSILILNHSWEINEWNYRSWGLDRFPWSFSRYKRQPRKDMNIKDIVSIGDNFMFNDLWFSWWLDLDVTPNLDKFPMWVFKIQKLEHLSFFQWFTDDVTALPREIGLLKNVKYFLISENRFESIPDEIWEMENLEYLWLDDNPIKKLPTSIMKLVKLKRLILPNNYVEIPYWVRNMAWIDIV